MLLNFGLVFCGFTAADLYNFCRVDAAIENERKPRKRESPVIPKLPTELTRVLYFAFRFWGDACVSGFQNHNCNRRDLCDLVQRGQLEARVCSDWDDPAD